MSDKKAEEQAIAMTPSQIQELVASAVTAAVREMKKPNDYEQKKIEQEQNAIIEHNQTRKENAKQVLDDLAKTKWIRATCTHKRRDGTSRAVYVQNGNFIVCQKCQAVVMPETQSGCGGDYIFDNGLFNELMQMVGSQDIFA